MKLEKQSEKALADLDRWLKRQPEWKSGRLSSASGRRHAFGTPSFLGESDVALQLARFLNKHGVSWRDIHINVTPAQWLVDPTGGIGSRPRRIELAVVDRDRLAKRKRPFAPARDKDFLFDAIFSFKVAGGGWQRQLKNGKPARPPRGVAKSVEKQTKDMATYLRDLWAKSGYVVVIEEADHNLPPAPKPSDGLTVVHLKSF